MTKLGEKPTVFAITMRLFDEARLLSLENVDAIGRELRHPDQEETTGVFLSEEDRKLYSLGIQKQEYLRNTLTAIERAENADSCQGLTDVARELDADIEEVGALVVRACREAVPFVDEGDYTYEVGFGYEVLTVPQEGLPEDEDDEFEEYEEIVTVSHTIH